MKQLVAHGERHPQAHLDDNTVVHMRFMLRERAFTISEMADHTGVPYDVVWRAVRGQSYAHLNRDAPPVPHVKQPGKWFTKTCPRCKRRFRAKNPNANTCSGKCRVALFYKRTKRNYKYR